MIFGLLFDDWLPAIVAYAFLSNTATKSRRYDLVQIKRDGLQATCAKRVV